MAGNELKSIKKKKIIHQFVESVVRNKLKSIEKKKRKERKIIDQFVITGNELKSIKKKKKKKKK